MRTCFINNFTGQDFYELIKKKYCAEFDVIDEGKDGEVYFTHDGEYVDYLEFVHFLRGFEAANHCVENAELIYVEKKKAFCKRNQT